MLLFIPVFFFGEELVLSKVVSVGADHCVTRVTLAEVENPGAPDSLG